MKQLIAAGLVAAAVTACGGTSSDNPFQALNDASPVTVAITPNAPSGGAPSPTGETTGPCIDDNDDGYGWNGVASCQVAVQPTPAPPTPTESAPVITQPAIVQTELEQVSGSIYQCQIRTTAFSRVFNTPVNGSGGVSETSGNIMGVWRIEGDQVSLNLSNGNVQYTITGTQLVSTSGWDGYCDHVSGPVLQAGPAVVAPPIALATQWPFNCSLNDDPSTNWVWVLDSNNKIYDLAGQETGRWRYFDSGHIGLGPNNNPAPKTTIDGNNIRLGNQWGDYGICKGSTIPPLPQLLNNDDYPMFHCHEYGSMRYQVFAPNGNLLSQYGVVLGSYTNPSKNVYSWSGITYDVDDQNTMKGRTGERLEEFCAQHTGNPFYQP